MHKETFAHWVFTLLFHTLGKCSSTNAIERVWDFNRQNLPWYGFSPPLNSHSLGYYMPWYIYGCHHKFPIACENPSYANDLGVACLEKKKKQKKTNPKQKVTESGIISIILEVKWGKPLRSFHKCCEVLII